MRRVLFIILFVALHSEFCVICPLRDLLLCDLYAHVLFFQKECTDLDLAADCFN